MAWRAVGSAGQETEKKKKDKRKHRDAKEMYGAQKLTNIHEFTLDLWEEQISNNFKKVALVTYDRNVEDNYIQEEWHTNDLFRCQWKFEELTQCVLAGITQLIC